MIPLFIRALPLSISTLWHYIFLFPLVLAVSLPFLLLTIIPLVGLPVTWGVITFIGFAGYRCALTAQGHGNEPSFIKLVMSSLTMGIIVALCAIFFLALSVAIGTGIGLLGIGEDVELPAGISLPFAAGLSGAIYLVLNSLFYFCMAVPMTAVAHAATPKGRDTDPFFGFGAGLFSLMAAWALWIVGMIYFRFFESLGEGFAYAIWLMLESLLDTGAEPPYLVDWAYFAAAVLYLLWGTCWFSATAVLAWDRTHQKRKLQKVETASVPRVSADELRALREARMPGSREEQ